MDKNKLIETLETGAVEEKAAALESLRETKDIKLIVPLTDALEKEKSRAIKERILLVLNRLMPLSEFKEAHRMLRSPDPFVRNGIVEIIKHHEIPIIQFLEKLAEDDDKDVRKFVIDALSQEKSEKAIAIIRRRLDDSDINIVYTAIEYLGNFKDAGAVTTIENTLMAADNFMVICSGLEALAKIGQSPRKVKIFEKFMDDRIDEIPAIVFPFLKYLGAFGGEDALQYIEKIMDLGAETYAKELIDAISRIISNNRMEALPGSLRQKLEFMQQDSGNDVNRYAIIKLLARSGGDPETQLEQIRGMLQGENEMLRLCAVELLGDMGNAEDVEQLEEIAENTENDDLLEAIGDAVMKIEERL